MIVSPPPIAREDDFVQVWAAATVAQYHRQFHLAAIRFIKAATIAPNDAAKTDALDRAFDCQVLSAPTSAQGADV